MEGRKGKKCFIQLSGTRVLLLSSLAIIDVAKKSIIPSRKPMNNSSKTWIIIMIIFKSPLGPFPYWFLGKLTFSLDQYMISYKNNTDLYLKN